jgi:hypothetical protein
MNRGETKEPGRNHDVTFSSGTRDGSPMGHIRGAPTRLASYLAETVTNSQFRSFDLRRWDRFFLPDSLTDLVEQPPLDSFDCVEDDNRSAILPSPVAILDGVAFYVSVKGVGSPVDPYSFRRLDRGYGAELTDRPDVRARLGDPARSSEGGLITGELWLRGSPYGGQGLPHATTALRVSEMADLTSIGGFRIAPVLKVALLPTDLEERLRSVHWYRRYRGRIVQEIRLVPSNIRVYFHSRTTAGNDIARVFDLFSVDSASRAHEFEQNFVRSGVAVLTLFARSMSTVAGSGRYSGLDFEDVWLDKDAVLAPDGTAFFVDLEGIEPVTVDREDVREKLEDQIFRSLYEFMFAYEQIATERDRRFGGGGSRKRHFEAILESALAGDPFVRLRPGPDGVTLEVRNRLGDESLSLAFPLVDR